MLSSSLIEHDIVVNGFEHMLLNLKVRKLNDKLNSSETLLLIGLAVTINSYRITSKHPSLNDCQLYM